MKRIIMLVVGIIIVVSATGCSSRYQEATARGYHGSTKEMYEDYSDIVKARPRPR